MSKAPPLGAEVEPEANPLSRPLVPFGRRRKELGPEAEISPPAGAGTGTYRACRNPPAKETPPGGRNLPVRETEAQKNPATHVAGFL